MSTDTTRAIEPQRHWWHYTLGTRLIEIIAANHIARATQGTAKGERKAVWFSSRPTWEPTATKGIIVGGQRRAATIAEMVAKGGALVRLAVSADFARHTWAGHRKIGGVDPRVLDALVSCLRKSLVLRSPRGYAARHAENTPPQADRAD